MHNCGSITHRFQFWHTDKSRQSTVSWCFEPSQPQGFIYIRADNQQRVEYQAKTREWNRACLIRFLSAVLVGSKVISWSSIPVLTGCRAPNSLSHKGVPSHPSGLFRGYFYPLVINLEGITLCSELQPLHKIWVYFEGSIWFLRLMHMALNNE